jgi:4-hydroxy-tetrahydrodipicolinate reductase
MSSKVAMLGVNGRMGRAIVSVLQESSDLQLVGALAEAGSEFIGQDAAFGVGKVTGVKVVSDAAAAIAQADVAIDFTIPAATRIHLAACVKAGKPLVVGTTGIDATGKHEIDAAAKLIPIMFAPNMSAGVNVLYKLAQIAAQALGAEYDVEIFEAHHKHKLDTPSGTAVRLGEAIASAQQLSFKAVADYERAHAPGPRKQGSIGFSVARGGDIVGDHIVMFAGPSERIEIVHRAHDRKVFAQGAVRAARWIVGRPAGLYSMQDVLGLNEPG